MNMTHNGVKYRAWTCPAGRGDCRVVVCRLSDGKLFADVFYGRAGGKAWLRRVVTEEVLA